MGERNKVAARISEQVFAALARTERPVGAYELARSLAAETGTRQHANTVYRALDRLIAARRVVHIASSKAYAPASPAAWPPLVLLCTGCGAVHQVPAADLVERLEALAADSLDVRRIYLEILGRCSLCRAEEQPGGAGSA